MRNKSSSGHPLFQDASQVMIRWICAFTLRFRPYALAMRHVVTLAAGIRCTTPVVLTELEYEGVFGYGEASMPPNLGESYASVMNFLSRMHLSRSTSPFLMDDILSYVDSLAERNTAAKAAIDIALHDLTGKLMGQPWHRIWGYNPAFTPYTTMMIGIDSPEIVRQKVKEAEAFKILKVKLGLDTDKMMIETIREVTDKPLCADVNQGWKTREEALEMAHWLAERN